MPQKNFHLYLSVDMAGQIFAQNVKCLPHFGLSAFGIKLGWVIMGKEKHTEERLESITISTLSFSLHASKAYFEEILNFFNFTTQFFLKK